MGVLSQYLQPRKFRHVIQDSEKSLVAEIKDLRLADAHVSSIGNTSARGGLISVGQISCGLGELGISVLRKPHRRLLSRKI